MRKGMVVFSIVTATALIFEGRWFYREFELRDRSVIDQTIPQNISAPTKARALKIAKKAFYEKAQEFGLSCGLDYGGCDRLMKRAENNPDLAKAIKRTYQEGVYVYPSQWFKIHSGYVDIDIFASDEEIIKFLTK